MSNNFNNLLENLYTNTGAKYGMSIKDGENTKQNISDQNTDNNSGKPTQQQITSWDSKYLRKKSEFAIAENKEQQIQTTPTDTNKKNIIPSNRKSLDNWNGKPLLSVSEEEIVDMSKDELNKYKIAITQASIEAEKANNMNDKIRYLSRLKIIDEIQVDRVDLNINPDSINNMKGKLLNRVSQKILKEIKDSKDSDIENIKKELEEAIVKNDNSIKGVMKKHINTINAFLKKKQLHGRKKGGFGNNPNQQPPNPNPTTGATNNPTQNQATGGGNQGGGGGVGIPPIKPPSSPQGASGGNPNQQPNNPNAIKNIRDEITKIRAGINEIRANISSNIANQTDIKSFINSKITEYNDLLEKINNIRGNVDNLQDTHTNTTSNNNQKKGKNDMKTALYNEISGIENTINNEIKELQKYIGLDTESLIKNKLEKPEEKLAKVIEGIKPIEQERIEVSKEVQEAWKDGEVKRNRLSDEDIEIFTAKYNIIIEDIDNKIKELDDLLQNKLTDDEKNKIGNKIQLLISQLKIKKESIEKAILNLKKIDYTEKMKKIEKAIEENNKKMEEIESLTKQMVALSQKSAQVEGKNAGIRFLKKFGAITYTAEDKLNWLTMVAKRSMLVKQVGTFYKKSLNDLYDIDAEGNDVGKKKKLIESVKEIREKMYQNKTNRFDMIMKNILVSTSLEVATAFNRGENKAQEYTDALRDSFSSNKERRDDARATLREFGIVVGVGAGAITGGLAVGAGIGGAILGNVAARGVGVANDAFYKKYGTNP